MTTPLATRVRRWLRTLLLAACTGCVGCSSHGTQSEPEPESVVESVGPSPGQWVLDVESAHLRIDGALAIGDPAAARRHIALALSVPVPGGVGAEHRRVVHQDLLFRLASTELSAGDHRAALRASERGLALGRVDDLFTANLLLSAGRANESLGRDAQAVENYHRALKINEALLSRVLARDAGAP